MTLRFNLKWVLTLLFIALGPLGNLLTPNFLPSAFRAYYFILPLFPLFFLPGKGKEVKIGILFLPFLIYCAVSALIVETFEISNEPFAFFRFLLFASQFFFILGAVSNLKSEEQMKTILKTYLRFYFFSLGIGYIFFLGYYLNAIPLSIIERFSVLTQFSFNLLRFSPGSYPNEYGIVSSFVLSVLGLIFLEKRKVEFGFSTLSLFFLFFATFLALILTTTRAAYLSLFISAIYALWQSNRRFKGIALILSPIFALFFLLSFFKIDMLKFILAGFSQSLYEGSLGSRTEIWVESAEKALENSLWGAGFASLTNIHNVYLQTVFELGVVGIFLLLGTLFFLVIETHSRYIGMTFFSKIRVVGLIHILSFAMSNHNLNHHLTWFVCFLCLAIPKVSRSSSEITH